MKEFIDMFNFSIYPELMKEMFDNLQIQDLINIKRTCSSYQKVLEEYGSVAWHINRHLLQFFDDPQGFRSLMAKKEAIVSGSSALQFFDTTHWPSSDLDIFVQVLPKQGPFNESNRYNSRLNFEKAHSIAKYIIHKENYVFVPCLTRLRDCFFPRTVEALETLSCRQMHAHYFGKVVKPSSSSA